MRATTIEQLPRAGRAAGPRSPSLHDFAALGLAVGLADHDPALALAAVLTGAAVLGRAARALALAIVAAHALHLGGLGAAAALCGHGVTGKEQTRHRGGDQRSLDLLVHDCPPFTALSTGARPMRAGRRSRLRTLTITGWSPLPGWIFSLKSPSPSLRTQRECRTRACRRSPTTSARRAHPPRAESSACRARSRRSGSPGRVAG